MSVEAESLVVSGQVAYLWIPAEEIRGFADGLFPYLAKCPLADVAQGAGHRFKTGHDLFVDVPRTFAEQGLGDAAHQTGHIVLTDFPTKAGIPIPGLSGSGLGEWLIGAGIPKGWLSLNLCDAGLGIIAIPEGASDLLNAISGTMTMDTATFFDTFGEGSVEIALALTLSANPLPLGIAGIANLLAGIVATVNTIAIHVDPITFFGSSLTSALIGFVVGQSITRKSVSESLELALRGGTIGALFAVSAPFGFGAICAILAYQGGKALKEHQQESSEQQFTISEESAKMFLEEARRLSPWIDDLMSTSSSGVLSAEVTTLPSEIPQLDSDSTLLNGAVLVCDARIPLLNSDFSQLCSIFEAFKEDQPPEGCAPSAT